MRRIFEPRKSVGGGTSSESFKLKITRALLFPLCVILLFACVLVSAPLTGGNTASAASASVGEILLSGYEDTTSGKVFDAVKLNELYQKILGSSVPNAKYSDVYNKVAGMTNWTVKSSTASGAANNLANNPSAYQVSNFMTSRDLNDNAALYVKFAGYDWAVTYVTRDLDNNVIATLMLKDPNQLTTKTSLWNEGTAKYEYNGNSYNYPYNMYASSYVRVVTLNAGSSNGDPTVYSTHKTAASYNTLDGNVGIYARANNQFAKFTLANIKGSLTNYITTPSRVRYQGIQSWAYLDIIQTNGASTTNCNLNNEAYEAKTVIDRWSMGNYMTSTKSKNYAGGWMNDYLWLPSLTEIGADAYGKTPALSGVWRTQTEVRNVSYTYLSRTGGCGTQYAQLLQMPGWNDVNTGMIRPCMHLNLTAAEAASAEMLTKPTVSQNFTYNGKEQTIDFTTLAGFDSDKMEVTGISRDGGNSYTAPSFTATEVKFTDAGKYTITLKTKPTTVNGATRNYVWKETAANTPYAATTEIEITVAKRKITVPVFSATTGIKTYTGSPLVFAVPDYPNQNIAATATDEYPRDALSIAVARKVNNTAASYTDSFAYATTNNPKGMEISARDAGDYTVTFKVVDTTNYEWAGGTNDTADKTANFTINPKQLSITVTSTETGDALKWSADSASSYAEFTIVGIVATDAVDAKIKLTRDGDTSFTGIANAVAKGTPNADGTDDRVAKVDATTFGISGFSAGSYPVTPVIDGTAADNVNYSFADALTTWSSKKIVIEAVNAGLPSYDNIWRYVKDNSSDTTPQTMPADKKFEYSFNQTTNAGTIITISLDQTDFVTNHIQVDLSKYNSGFKDESASAVGKYKTIVALKTTSADYAFTLPDNTKSQTLEIELEWEITAAAIDLSGAKWKYTDADGVSQVFDPATATETNGELHLPWTGQNYTLTLTDLPAGVTVNASNYTDNKAKYIGKHTAKPTTISFDSTNYTITNMPELKWEIVAAKVKIDSTTWATTQQTSGSGFFYLPHLNSPYDGTGIQYKYFLLGDDKGGMLASPQELTDGVSGIVTEQDNVHYYYVEAYICSDTSTDGVTKWDAALVLDDQRSPTPDNGVNTYAFTTGSNLTPVSVTMSGNPFTYDGDPHGILNTDIIVKVGNNSFADVAVKYYAWDDSATDKKGAPLGGDGQTLPVNAGDYYIEVTLTGNAGDDYFLSTSSLKLTIEPFQFDMSQVRWGYLDKDGNEQVYNPSVPLYYELELDQDNKPIPEGSGFKAKKHTLMLVNLPKGDASGDADAQLLAKMFAESGLEGLITYSGNYSESSVTPDGAYYTATYAIDTSSLSKNFELVSMPDATLDLPDNQNWRIEARLIDKPKDDKTHTFDGKGYDLLELAGLDYKDLGVYYTLTGFGYMNEDNERVDLDPADVRNIVNAATYRLTFGLIDTANVKWNANGVPKITSQSCTIIINKLFLTVIEWEDISGDNDAPKTPVFKEGTVDSTVYDFVITDSSGKIVEGDEWMSRWNETFKQTVVPSAGNENNVEISFDTDVPEEVTFTVGDDPDGAPAKELPRPTFNAPVNEDGSKSFVYTGKPQSFMPSGLQDLIDEDHVRLFAVDEEGHETQVDSSYFTQTNAGKYKVLVRIKGNFKWKDGDKSDLAFVYEITPAPLTPVWKTDEGGKISADMPADFKDVGNAFDLHYYNENGEEVAEKDLQNGTQYRVGVTLKEEHKNNFVLQNSDGTVPADGVVYSDDLYTHTSSGFMSFIGSSYFGLPLWLWILLALLLIILLIIIIVAAKKRKKKNAEEKEKNAAKKEEKERLEAEKREREEEKRRQQEEREEEKRRKEEERQEEKRRKDEEREEERRRKEEEREEEKRRREEQREEEKRRREEREEDERHRREMMAAAGTLGSMQGMNGMPNNGMNGMMNHMGAMNSPQMQPQMQQQMPMQQPMPPVPPMPPQQPPQSQMSAPQAPQYAPQSPQPVVQQVIRPASDSQSYGRLREYELRLRTLERELEEKRLENIRSEEHAKAQREMEALQEQRRREEEMLRLRELQAERDRRYEQEALRRRDTEVQRLRERRDMQSEMKKRRREMEEARLRELEEQIRRKEEENRLLEERFRETYAPYPQEVIRLDPDDPRYR